MPSTLFASDMGKDHQKPSGQDYGLRAFVFEDPDGNRIDVGQVI
jgi:hypothetical protein